MAPAPPRLAIAAEQPEIIIFWTSLPHPVNANLPRAAFVPWINEDDTVMQDDLAWSVPARADQASDACLPTDLNQLRETTRAAILPLRAPDPLPAA